MFTSLDNSSVNDTFKDSIFNGLSIDGGLYYPKEIKVLNIFAYTSFSFFK